METHGTGRAGAVFAVALAFGAFSPAAQAQNDPATTQPALTDAEWRQQMEARMQQLEQENAELRKTVGQVRDTQQAVMKDAESRGVALLRGRRAAADDAGLLRRQQVRLGGRFPRLVPDPRHEDVASARRLRPARRDLRLRPHRQRGRVRRQRDPDRRREDRRRQQQLQHPPVAPVPEDRDADGGLGQARHVHRDRLPGDRRRRAARPSLVRADRRQVPVPRRPDVERVPGRDGIPGGARLAGPARHHQQPPPAGPVPAGLEQAVDDGPGGRGSQERVDDPRRFQPASRPSRTRTSPPTSAGRRSGDTCNCPASCGTSSSIRTTARARASSATA